MKKFICGAVLCFSLLGVVGNAHAGNSKVEKRISQGTKIAAAAGACSWLGPIGAAVCGGVATIAIGIDEATK
ncbi:MAG: hypothetical protein LBU29_02020 [Endomicrobium sp.]|jgi:hypothetical protein|nr:hypothetical protein [Endomicrobium sp.]